MFCKKGVLRNFAKFTESTLLKKRLWRRCFPVNFAKFLRETFLTEYLQWLLLWFKKYSWLYYDIKKGSLTYHKCKQQNKESNFYAERCKGIFLQSGCKNWKKTTENFDQYEVSNFPKPALTYEVVYSICEDTAEMLLKENDSKTDNKTDIA